jgi:hypothetical protein
MNSIRSVRNQQYDATVRDLCTSCRWIKFEDGSAGRSLPAQSPVRVIYQNVSLGAPLNKQQFLRAFYLSRQGLYRFPDV